MTHDGYEWSIRDEGDSWRWALRPRGEATVVLSGTAPTRAVAAAMVVRALARGMTPQVQEMAA